MNTSEGGPQGLAAREMMTIDVVVARPIDMGVHEGRGTRLMPIVGGRVTGSYQGEVLPGGADWQSIGPDGTIDIRARYVIALPEGLVDVRSEGLRHGPPEVLARLARGEPVPSDQYYFRTSMTFHSAAEKLHRLNGVLGIAIGERTAEGVRLRVYEIL